MCEIEEYAITFLKSDWLNAINAVYTQPIVQIVIKILLNSKIAKEKNCQKNFKKP